MREVSEPIPIRPASASALAPTGAQLPRTARPVTGISFDPFVGVRESVTGFELDLVNVIEGDLDGLGVGLTNSDGENTRGARIAGVDMAGVQAGAFASRPVGAARGVQLALVSAASGPLRGARLSPIARVADECDGVQVGLLDLGENGLLPVLPLLNFSTR